MNLAPPPPACSTRGTLAAVAEAFSAQVAREERMSWVASSSSLVVVADAKGRACLGARKPTIHPAPLEECGLRSLMVFYNDAFPRATPVLSRLSAASFASVFAELFDATDPRQVRVCDRLRGPGPRGYRSDPEGNLWRHRVDPEYPETGAWERATPERAVYAVVPVPFAVDYDVAAVVGDVALLFGDAAGDVPCSLTYDPGPSSVVLVLELAEYDVVVTATDQYDAGGVQVSVRTKAGVDLGDPLPAEKRRRFSRKGAEGGGVTIAEGLAAKIAAAPDYFARMARVAQTLRRSVGMS